MNISEGIVSGVLVLEKIFFFLEKLSSKMIKIILNRKHFQC